MPGGQKIESLYQEIGREALSLAGRDLHGRLLVYAELGDGVVSADLIYKNKDGDARLVVGPDSLSDLAYQLWEQWREQPENEPFRLMSYVVDPGGKMSIDLTYSEDVDEDEDELDRRDRMIKKYFGDAKVVWTKRLP